MKDTIVYFITHSETFSSKNIFIIKNSDNIQLPNEKVFLSIEGEKKAHELSKLQELHNIDAVYSSNYESCLQTAKYFTSKDNQIIYIDERFNERIEGNLDSLSHYDFDNIQAKNFDYKLVGGESLNEVKKRMATATKQVLMNEAGKRVIVITHNKALIALLSLWCEVGYNYDDEIILTFNDKTVFDGSSSPLMGFKVTFDGMSVLNVESIEL